MNCPQNGTGVLKGSTEGPLWYCMYVYCSSHSYRGHCFFERPMFVAEPERLHLKAGCDLAVGKTDRQNDRFRFFCCFRFFIYQVRIYFQKRLLILIEPTGLFFFFFVKTRTTNKSHFRISAFSVHSPAFFVQ